MLKTLPLLMILGIVSRTALASEMPPGVSSLLGNKAAIARALVEPVAACVARKDTAHPVFKGCIDWHSAAHGTWALVAYTRLTGDRRYEGAVRQLLDPARVGHERDYLNQHPEFEMPYGRAWFLRLAIDHQRTFGDGLFREMADDVAKSLVAFYSRVPPDPMGEEYGNPSWALINLLHHARFRGDEPTKAFVEGLVRRHFVANGAKPCVPAEEGPVFMAICTNWAWLVSEVLPREEFIAWLQGFLPADTDLSPVTQPRNAHENGLNFSRAWGLWALFTATGQRRFADAYAAHFNATFTRRWQWAGDYRSVAHWVAQFGLYALAPLWGEGAR